MLLATLAVDCAPRYSYVVPTQEVARYGVNVGAEVTLRTRDGRLRRVTVDGLRAANGASHTLVLSTYQTRTPLWFAVPLALTGTVAGSLVGLAGCFEGCREPGLVIAASGALFTVTGALLGWGLGSLIGLAVTAPAEAEVAVPGE